MRRIFVSVGEPSGDIHGANLIRELGHQNADSAPDQAIEFVGYGGQRMQTAGCHLLYDLASLAVMGILPVLRQIGFFWKLVGQVDRYFAEHQVDAVVLIDFPGFNWWVARKAKKHNIPVFYYGVPQMWGWAPWRVRKMRRWVDHAICKLPFEEAWYRARGCDAVFVGHPFFDDIAARETDHEFVARLDDRQPLVLLLPGSRTQEVKTHVQPLINASSAIKQRRAHVQFAFACVNEKHAKLVREAVEKSGEPIRVFVGKTPELMQHAKCCVAVSGSVSLELMTYHKPTVILYQINLTSWVLQSLLRCSKYITLVNLLAAESIERDRWATFDPDRNDAEDIPFPEFLTTRDRSQSIARQIANWLENDLLYQQRVERLAKLHTQFGKTGATANAATYILQQLGLVTPASEDSRAA